jgi:hypothetical protein
MLGDKFVQRSDFMKLLKERSSSATDSTPASQSEALTQVLNKTPEALAAEKLAFLAAVESREKRVKTKKDAADKLANADYSKGFSGTAADTKAEKDFAKLAMGDHGAEEDDVPDDEKVLLAPLSDVSPHDLDAMRNLSPWCKVMGGTGCFIWVHPITRETATQRPENFVDEEVAEVNTDDFNGLPFVLMENLLPEIERIVDVEKKTPLLLDDSFDRNLATYFQYKGVLVDGTKMNLPLRNKARPKPKDWMENFRASAVEAMKRGQTLALDMGECDNGKLPLEKTLCKPDSVPKSIMLMGGRGLTSSKMYYMKVWREPELEHGEAIVNPDFRFVVITQHSPKVYAKEIGEETLNLDNFYPLVVVSGKG